MISDCTISVATNLQLPRASLIYHRIVNSAMQPARARREGPRAWIGETFRLRGFAGGLCYYIRGGVELLRDLSRTRRRSRYGDIDYDFEHLVDTTWATVTLRTRVRELLAGGQYQPTEPALFRQILEALPVSPNGFTFIDLGCGKGRTLLMASDYPFRRIVGIELLAEFEAAAQQNIARYHDERQRCCKLESQLGDARDFIFPSEPSVLYLFNPFPEHVLRAVLANLRNSLMQAPRPVFVLYHNLVFERVFAENGWLKAVHRTPQFAVYQALAT